jgi:hypothetical protein
MIGTWRKEGTNRPALIVCCLCNKLGISKKAAHIYLLESHNLKEDLHKESLFHPPVQFFPGIISSFMITVGRQNEEEGERYRGRTNN